MLRIYLSGIITQNGKFQTSCDSETRYANIYVHWLLLLSFVTIEIIYEICVRYSENADYSF